MDPLIQLKRATSVFFVVAACFALAPVSTAVSPPPDGGYPRQNTAEGEDALFSLRPSIPARDNTAIGYRALYSNFRGSQNTAIGSGALSSNTAGTGNTAIGWQALTLNTTNSFSTAIGYEALGTSTGGFNTATGALALVGNTTGGSNTANGVRALSSNTTGDSNTATGRGALDSNTTASFNTANGSEALFANTSGVSNTANGVRALFSNTTGDSNTATGRGALRSNTTGDDNAADGYQALLANTTGKGNTAVGNGALGQNTTGSFNTAVGNSAGANLTTGSDNIDIGHRGVAGESNTMRIGTIRQTATYITGISGAIVASGATVIVGADGHLGTVVSAERFKDDIQAMDKASEAIFALKPVTFHYKKQIDADHTPQFGLVAEDVAKVTSDLVVRDHKGEIYSVRYEAVNAMLLNEFLKEHRKVQQLEATVAEQRKSFESKLADEQRQIEALAAGLQKVNAQLEISKPAPQVAQNNQQAF
jgi:Chaperone of endosialidase